MRSDITDIEPTRAWDDLIAASKRRGTTLRRRRRALQSLPVALLLPLALLPHGASRTSSVEVVQRPDIVRPTPAPTAPRISPTYAERGGGGAPSRGARPSVHGSEVTRPGGSSGGPTAASPTGGASVRPPRALPPYRIEGFSADDLVSDADGGTGVATASQPAADIVEVEYKTDRDGLHLRVTTLEAIDDDPYYYMAWVSSDQLPACYLVVYLAGPTDSGYYLYCGGIDDDFVKIPNSVSDRTVTLTIAHNLMPGYMKPEAPLTFRATTNAGNAQTKPVDELRTTTTIRRR